MNGSKQTFSTLETVFSVMIAVAAFLPRGHAVDAAHAHASALFRLAMIGVGVIGVVMVYVLKKRLPPDATVTSSAPLPPGVAVPLESGSVRITYQVTQPSAWRGEIYNMTHRWQTILSLAGAPLVWFFLSLSAGVPALPIALAHLALIFLGWFALLGLVLGLQMRKRYPRPGSVRVCTTTLTAAGYEDITPDKTFSVPWREVTDVREHEGDIFLWRGATGNIINREAFQDRRQAQEFYAAARALWQGRAADWPYNPAPPDDRIWPPPPQAQ